MVAYSFQPRFVSPIKSGLKQQTIRSHRRRHARPGEPIQLYVGMRSRWCRKIIADDPVCIAVDEVRLDLRCLEGVLVPPDSTAAMDELVGSVDFRWNGKPITGALRHVVATADGFDDKDVFIGTREWVEPFHQMVMFWMATHGPVLFEGVAIRWEDGHVQP